ncbi:MULTISPECIES: DUF1636 family protein [Thalassospira]|jgi:predicted metal-binding protein|nr:MULTISPECIES: DUF1636 domain-containing protein [Thalassospira]MDM7977551.1 DUF1636 domain-containing protein [Thalassospira xiamenensis]OHZ04682.1 hypothetical protein BC440_06400 [Thalassospira sp. MIT1004]|tara:strand:- start:2683 stop:3063 length:381 start_codon:yes stop_codon:yes gene_type:complete
MTDTMSPKARLNICTTCTASSTEGATEPRHGRILFDKMVENGATLDIPFEIRAVECLTNCKSGCSVALNGKGKWGYVYGNIDPENMIADLQELATKYAETDDGIVPWRERPESLRRNVIARIPPLD